MIYDLLFIIIYYLLFECGAFRRGRCISKNFISENLHKKFHFGKISFHKNFL